MRRAVVCVSLLFGLAGCRRIVRHSGSDSESAGQDSVAGAASRDTILGSYAAPDGSSLTIFSPQLGLAFLHRGSGRLGLLHPDGEDRYVAGPGAVGREPVEVAVEVVRSADGRVEALRYSTENTRQLFTPQPALRMVEDNVVAGEVSLAVRATLPPGPGPFPVIVLNHGGGEGTRDGLQLWADFFAHRGLAAVTYDKRGSGETTGPDWQTFGDLADDAAAAARWADTADWATPDCVGLWAYSQSGWVVPLAARAVRSAFVLAVSVPAQSPAERAATSVRPRLLADGFSEEDAEAAARLVAAVNSFGRGEMEWDRYERELERVRDTAWFSRVEKTTSPEAPRRPFYATGLGRYLDPVPFWRELDVPILALYGSLDTTVPADPNATLLADALADNRDALVLIMPRANHQMLRAVTGGDDELAELNTYVNGYFEVLEDFARDRAEECAG